MKFFTRFLAIAVLLYSTSLTAQTITGMNTECLGGITITFAQSGVDGSGRNIYTDSAPVGMNTGISIMYNTAAMQWEVTGGGQVFFVAASTFSPNPPDSGTTPWTPAGSCTGNTENATIMGDGTQSAAGGGDPCDAFGGDSDGDGVCDDNDICPDFDDNIDPDMDGIPGMTGDPDSCDPNPDVADGVLITSDCFGGTGTPILLTANGDDGAGRNIYANTTLQIEVAYNATDMMWEIRAIGNPTNVFYTNAVTSVPNPPSDAAGMWVADAGNICAQSMAAVSGTGTQDMQCLMDCDDGDPCTTDTQDADCNCTNAPDAEAPVISNCPTTLSDGVVGATCLNAVPDYSPFITVTDNCTTSDPIVLQIPAAGTMLGVGMFEIKMVATDAAGNASDTCRFTLNNTDIADPVADCQDIEVFLDDAGAATITATDVGGGSTDNCGVVDTTLSQMDFSCADLTAPVEVTLTVLDAGGLMDDCMAMITVRDTLPPEITVSFMPDTIFLDEDGSVDISDFPLVADSPFGVASSSIIDNCTLSGGLIVSPPVLTCDDLGRASIQFSASDGSGNIGVFDTSLIVADKLAPIVMANDTILYLDENGLAELRVEDYEYAATDNCGDPTITDIFRFEEAAMMTGSAVGADAGAKESLDNSNDGAKSLDQVLSFTCDDLGNVNLRVEIIGTDMSGNETKDTITVTVLDTIKPMVVCTDLTVYLDENGFAGYTETDLFEATDNCAVDFRPFDIAFPLSCDDVGTDILADLRIADLSGNDTTCMVTVTVLDTLAPTILVPNFINVTVRTSQIAEACPGNTFLEDFGLNQDRLVSEIADFAAAQLGAAGLVAADFYPLFADNCTPDEEIIVRITSVESIIRTDGSDSITVIGNLVDEYNNLSVVDTAIVILIDDTAPEIVSCVTDTTIYLDENGFASIAPGELLVTTDNCGFPNPMLGDPLVAFDCNLAGQTFTFNETDVDASGNVSDVCTINVTVLDTIPPTITCAAIAPFVSVGDDCLFQEAPGTFLTSDNCGDPVTFRERYTDADGNVIDDFSFEFIVGSFMIGTDRNLPLGINTVELFITDRSGLESSCSFTLDVRDTSPPEVVTTDQALNLTDTEITMTLTPADLATATDNCGEPITIEFDRPLIFTSDDIGVNVITVTATDSNGNVTETTVTVTVTFDQPNLACITGINLTLNDECKGLLIPEMLLTGNTGLLSSFQFDITVNDDNPSNGPVVDGCGRFQYSISADPVNGLDFETCWGWVNAEDKTPPATVFTPDDVELLCVDVDGNTLTTLPNTISKCYRVNSADGSTVRGSMSTVLRDRLRAGGTTPLVPLFTDGCTDEIEVCVSDVLVYDAQAPACNDVVLTRTFTATEISVCPSAAGEENPSVIASYVITFSRPSLDDLNDDNVQDVVEYEQCGVANPTRADYPAPRAGDYPFLEVAGRTFNLSSGDAVCNIDVTYSDGEPIVTCPFTYKFVRTYTVIDWCDPSDVRTFTQVVKVGDTTAPTFTGPTQDRDFDGVADDDLIYTTNAGNICAAYIRLDAGVSAVDNCSDNVTITASIYPGGDLDATPIGAFDVDPTDNNAEVTSAIPVGCHVLRYTFTDECGNSDFEDFDFCVEDGTAPVAICEDGLNISISSGSAAGGASTGIAILTPGMIDGGSYDDCSGVTLSIACVNGDNINTEPYDQELVLTCADLGIKRVGLRVEDAEGNVNYCWLDVLVEDKNAPSCIAPGPVNISCIVAKATLPADIMEATEAELDATFGFATGVDNCEVTITSTITGNVNSCGVGSFNRVFTATDGEGFTNTNNCRQRITVYGVHDYRLTFPTDEEGGCADIPSYDGIAAQEDACDLITTDVTVDTLRTLLAGEECFKLRVTYDVVNWCEYGTLGQPYLIPRDGDGIRNPETQALYLNVDQGTDQTTTSDDFAFLSRFSDRNYNPGAPQNDQLLDDGDDMDGTDDDNGNDNIDDDAYAADASRGHFRYIQYIKIYDEVAPVITSDAPADCFAGTSATCTAEVELTFTATDECSAASVQVELDADYNAATGFVRTTGVSATNDGAGNFTINLSDIPVGNHAIRVRASDGCGNFDVEIIEFCVTGDKAPTPVCISQLTVTLMPDGQGGGMAAIWAFDFIASDVEDCFGNVIDKYSIYTEEEAGAAGFSPAAGRLGLELTCDDDATVPVRVYAIDDNGSADYCSVFVLVQQFQEGLCEGTGGNLAGNIATQDDYMMEGVEVTLTGENDMDEMVVTAANGAYTFTNLPLGVDYTIQPDYNVGVDLAEVKVSDVVKIGSVILGTSSFDTGYDFIAGDVDMDGSLSIFDMVAIQRVILGLDETFATGETWRFVTEEYNLTTSNWASSFPEVYNANDLAGLLSGVDFVAVQMGNVIREAGRSALNLETEDASLEAGQTHTMVLTAATMSGFQGTIELAAGLELIDVTYEGEGGLNLNAAAEGMIGIVLREATSLTLEVRATEAGQLSELVSLSDALVLTEGVDLNGASTGLGLAFNGSSIAPAYSALLQNTPNPVVESTTIRFELAAASRATLSVRDAAGRVVMVRQLDAVAGRNRVDLTVADLGAAGVLTYTLTADDFSATKKMVVVR